MTIQNANGSNAYIAFCEQDQSVADTAPTNPLLYKLAATDFNVNPEFDSVQSNVIRNDRKTSGYKIVGKNITGDMGIEERTAVNDDDHLLLRSALFSGDQSYLDTTASSDTLSLENAVITVADDKIDLSGCTVVPDNIQDYQKIKITGSANDNDGIYTITNVSGDEYLLSPSVAANETCGGGVEIKGKFISDSNVKVPFFIEKAFTDSGTPSYEHFIGNYVNTYMIDIPTSGIVTSKINTISINSTAPISTPYASATYQEFDEVARSNMAAPKNCTIYINDSVNNCQVIKTSISIDNKLVGLKSASTFGNCNISDGAIEIESAMTLYFTDNTFKNYLINEGTFSYDILLTDIAGNEIMFSMPQMKVKTESTPVSNFEALNQELTVDAEYNSDIGSKMQVTIFSA